MTSQRLRALCTLVLSLLVTSGTAFARPLPNTNDLLAPSHAVHDLATEILNQSLSVASADGSQPPYTLELVDQIGGQMNLVVLRPPYAYVTAGPRILVLDVSDPANVSLVGRSDILPNNFHNMVLAGDRLVGEIFDGELLSVDISQPLTPTLTAHAQVYNRTPSGSTEQTKAIAADGDRVYLLSYTRNQLGAYGNDYLRTVDATTLSPLGTHTLNTAYSDLTVAGTALFGVRTSGGLTSFDVANPALPQERQTLTFTGAGGRAATLGNQVIVAQRLEDAYALRILDSADPGNMVQTGIYTQTTERGIIDLQAEAGVAYVRLSGFTLDMPSTEVDLFDLSEPTPQRLGVYTDSVRTADMAVSGGRIYLAHLNSGLQVMDALASSGNQVLDNFAHRPYNQTVTVSADYLYATGGGWVGAFSLAYPESPTLFSVTDLGEPTTTDMVIAANRGYVSGAKVIALDLSAPHQPTILARGGQGNLAGLATANGLLYGAVDGSTGGVFVMDPAADPALAVVGSETSYPGRDIAVAGSYSVVPNGSNGAHLYDLSDPHAPKVLSTIAAPLLGAQTVRQPNPTWTEYDSVAVRGNLAFLGAKEISCCLVYNENGALWVIDIANPTRPAVRSTLYTRSLIRKIDLGVRYGFLATSTGPMVIDAADPANIDLIASASTRNLVDIATFGDNITIYTTDTEWGLLTWRFPGRTRAQISPSGGELHVQADQTSYLFGSGVFSESVTVLHTPLLPEQAPPAADLQWAGHAFVISAEGQNWQTAQGIQSPFTVTVGISAADRTAIISGTLALYRWDGIGWQMAADSHADAADERVTATVDRWGTYAILGNTRRIFLPLVTKP